MAILLDFSSKKYDELLMTVSESEVDCFRDVVNREGLQLKIMKNPNGDYDILSSKTCPLTIEKYMLLCTSVVISLGGDFNSVL